MRPRPRLAAAAFVLALLATPPASAEPPAGSAPPPPGLGPAILLHGIRGTAETFTGLVPVLEAAGYDPIVVEYVPESPSQHLPALAAFLVQPTLEAELRARGWGEDAPLVFLGHSTGGLIARFLVEQPGADVDEWDDARGWSGDGTPDVSPRWSRAARAVVMLATPNHGAGTGLARFACTRLPRDPFRSAACDVARGSTFLRRMSRTVPKDSRAAYLGIGAEPPVGYSVGEADLDGDGLPHGNDGVVLAESPHLPGGSFALWRGQSLGTHTRLACNAGIADWVLGFLSAPTSFPRWQVGGAGTSPRDLCRGRGLPAAVRAARPGPPSPTRPARAEAPNPPPEIR
ncbi:hypothetical protein L6R50_18000 [Myxococcota bacterium]|nr:hypothetical protein [Myxococcota bacterium]